jgi:hypothetical protein
MQHEDAPRSRPRSCHRPQRVSQRCATGFSGGVVRVLHFEVSVDVSGPRN